MLELKVDLYTTLPRRQRSLMFEIEDNIKMPYKAIGRALRYEAKKKKKKKKKKRKKKDKKKK